jgi:transcriptional regulator with XRE-family HTH domain
VTWRDWQHAGMTWAADLGRRVATRRVELRWSVQAAAREAGIARDTWRKIEAGESVQDTKRAIVLDVLGLDEHGRPVAETVTGRGERSATAPPPRLDEATLDELLDEIAARRARPGTRLPDLEEGRSSRRRRLQADAAPVDRAAYDDGPDPDRP